MSPAEPPDEPADELRLACARGPPSYRDDTPLAAERQGKFPGDVPRCRRRWWEIRGHVGRGGPLAEADGDVFIGLCLQLVLPSLRLHGCPARPVRVLQVRCSLPSDRPDASPLMEARPPRNVRRRLGGDREEQLVVLAVVQRVLERRARPSRRTRRRRRGSARPASIDRADAALRGRVARRRARGRRSGRSSP